VQASTPCSSNNFVRRAGTATSVVAGGPVRRVNGQRTSQATVAPAAAVTGNVTNGGAAANATAAPLTSTVDAVIPAGSLTSSQAR